MSTADVSVIVLNYNGRQWLKPCLDALVAQTGAPPFEVVVVDNASADGSSAYVREHFPAVRVHDAGGNLGFSGGNNAGARQARGRLLVFLNNDTVVAPDWLDRLVSALEARPEFGFATSRIVSADDPGRIDSAGDGYLFAGGAFKRGYGQESENFSQPGEVFGACGCAMVMKRELFEALGGFDPSFFIFYEDVDLSYRAQLLGARCWYAADAIVHHAGSATMGRQSARAVFFGQRNLEWTWLKNTPAPLLLRSFIAHAIYSAAGVAYYAKEGLLWPVLKAKCAALAGVPRILAERRRVQRERQTDLARLERLLTRSWWRLKRREKGAGGGYGEIEAYRLGRWLRRQRQADAFPLGPDRHAIHQPPIDEDLDLADHIGTQRDAAQGNLDDPRPAVHVERELRPGPPRGCAVRIVAPFEEAIAHAREIHSREFLPCAQWDRQDQHAADQQSDGPARTP